MTLPARGRMVAAQAYGAQPASVRLEEVALPSPGPGEALVAVEAAAITADELTWPDRSPFVPAHDVAGRVVALGGGATGVALDDRVYGLVGFDRPGAAAAYVVVPAAHLAPRPSGLGPVRAAAVPLAALTAWQALVEHARVEPGQRVLVHGGAGGVGHYAVQLAAWRGARVTATASSRDLGFVASLGASEVIDYADRFEERVAGMDVVVDTVGGDVLARSWSALSPGGLLVGVAAQPDPSDPAAAGRRGLYFVVEPDGAQLRQIGRLLEEGRLRPTVGRVFGLSDAAAAFACQRDEHVRGKIVIEVGSRAG